MGARQGGAEVSINVAGAPGMRPKCKHATRSRVFESYMVRVNAKFRCYL